MNAAVPMAHALLFVLAVLAIVPLAALLSRATEAVAEKTGDTVGGLLNATLGNLAAIDVTGTRASSKRMGLWRSSLSRG
jgi:Ca2+:H+ antiporter